MPTVQIGDKTVETSLEVSDEEAEAGVNLGFTHVRIEMGTRHYSATGVAKLSGEAGSPGRKILDLDLASAARDFHSQATALYTITHLVRFVCGDRDWWVSGTEFFGWLGLELPGTEAASEKGESGPGAEAPAPA